MFRLMPLATMIAVALVLTVRPASAQSASSDPLDGRVIREIRISPGLTPGTAEVVMRTLSSRQGEPFHHEALKADHRRLDALRRFSSIEIQAEAADDEVTLVVDIQETLRLLPFLALSVTDENGASVGAGFRGINLLGGGSQSSATVMGGGATTVGARVERPTVTPGAWELDASVAYRSRRNELFDFDETSTTIGVTPAGTGPTACGSAASANSSGSIPGYSDIALSADGTDHLPSAAGYFSYNSTRLDVQPARGMARHRRRRRAVRRRARLDARRLDGRRYQPLSAKSTLSVVGFGSFSPARLAATPGYEEFGVGGANSVRGWSLGLRLGKHQAIGTLEDLYTLVPVRPFTVFGLNLYGGVQAAALSDVGLAWNAHPHAKDAIDGYGVGLRLLFPFIDVLRLDLAWGEPGGGSRLLLAIKLKADKQRDRVR